MTDFSQDLGTYFTDNETFKDAIRTYVVHLGRFYVCLKVCKDSFISCRPIIALDGCFLKGFYSSELLTTIGRDPNDQMLPLAYVVVQVECKGSWSWFFKLLIENVGGVEVCAIITFMSDQQKVYSLLSIIFFVCV